MPEALPVQELIESLRAHDYLADRGLATVLSLSLALEKPLLLEGEAGVGKTELAKVLAEVEGARLIRLQCYEGIDVAHALYDWSYARQLLYIRTLELSPGDARGNAEDTLTELFGPAFLERRPLLEAIESDDPVVPVLLIDEIDRADDEFEAFLLELLSDFQVTIPEIGTIRATRRPRVILTSNRTRELHDALRRRCLYHWIGHPDVAREIAIVRARVPGVSERLAAEAAAFVARLREADLAKVPGVAETIDWTQALVALGQTELSATAVDDTLGSVVKDHEDLDRVRSLGLEMLVAEAART
jgi:MoxR-like ATPase